MIYRWIQGSHVVLRHWHSGILVSGEHNAMSSLITKLAHNTYEIATVYECTMCSLQDLQVDWEPAAALEDHLGRPSRELR